MADVANNVIRKITASTGIITTVAGNGVGAGSANGLFGGDGGLATKAAINHPMGVAVDAAGDLLIADTGNQRVREVNGSTGIITTIAGNGVEGYSSSGKGTEAMLNNPDQLALDNSGNLYIAEMGASVITKLNLSTGTINTVAGSGTSGAGTKVLGDGGPATQAQLAGPMGVAVNAAGDVFIADSDNQRVRKVSASTGMISTVVGSSGAKVTAGYAGDGGPSGSAQPHNPEGLFSDASGNLYIADSYNSVIRKVLITPADIPQK